MGKIKQIYLISHTHTDIGYTDHQDTLSRQQLGFIDRAIELGEATADYPSEARYKWTCEVSSYVEQYFRERPASQVDRFLELHHKGQMAVAGMAYHWTPMLSTAGMIRSLMPVMRLRSDYGLDIRSAMQCDVDGASWLWADLLPAAGINSLTMSINMHRGRRPQPDLIPFWWRGPGGGKLLTLNGPHYAMGIFRYGLGDIVRTEARLPEYLGRLEERNDYPFDFLYAQVTHPTRADNGPPLAELSDFVRDWNASGRTPRMVFSTIDGFTDMLHARYADQLETWEGDWVDWWADGVASSAYETGMNRATEELLPVLDLLSTQTDGIDLGMIEQAYQQVYLYDEHTWGGAGSIRFPHAHITKSIWNQKASYAYKGFSLTHELIADGGRELARALTGVTPEGEYWREWNQGIAPDLADNRFLMINPSSWARHLRWQIPPDVGGMAPHATLEMFLVDNYREGVLPMVGVTPAMVVDAHLPPFGYEVVDYTMLPAASEDASARDGILENQWYRLEIDPVSGGIRSWIDKELGRELASDAGPWRSGQYVYEWVDHPDDRRAIFDVDFSMEHYGVRKPDTPFRRSGPTLVELQPARSDPRGTVIEARIEGRGMHGMKVRYRLPHHEKALHMDIVLDKESVTKPESVYIPFNFAIEDPTFHLDLNGVPLEPEAEQFPGSCRDWYGIHRWAEVGDDDVSVVVVPVDAPLIQVGGIQTGRWAWKLDIQQAAIVSWPLQNHWDTNFQASQSGEILLRYRLTSSRGYDPAAASRFAMEATVPPLIIRVPGAQVGASGQFCDVSPQGVAEIQFKRAEDGRGVIVHAYNLKIVAQDVAVRFPLAAPTAAWQCSPVEEDGEALSINDGAITLAIPARSVACARVVLS